MVNSQFSLVLYTLDMKLTDVLWVVDCICTHMPSLSVCIFLTDYCLSFDFGIRLTFPILVSVIQCDSRSLNYYMWLTLRLVYLELIWNWLTCSLAWCRSWMSYQQLSSSFWLILTYSDSFWLILTRILKVVTPVVGVFLLLTSFSPIYQYFTV